MSRSSRLAGSFVLVAALLAGNRHAEACGGGAGALAVVAAIGLPSSMAVGAAATSVGFLIYDAAHASKGTRPPRGYAIAEVVLGTIQVVPALALVGLGAAIDAPSQFNHTDMSGAMFWGPGLAWTLLSTGILAHGAYLLANPRADDEKPNRIARATLVPTVVGDKGGTGPGLALVGRF
jgi:hypothetical protein